MTTAYQQDHHTMNGNNVSDDAVANHTKQLTTFVEKGESVAAVVAEDDDGKQRDADAEPEPPAPGTEDLPPPKKKSRLDGKCQFVDGFVVVVVDGCLVVCEIAN